MVILNFFISNLIEKNLISKIFPFFNKLLTLNYNSYKKVYETNVLKNVKFYEKIQKLFLSFKNLTYNIIETKAYPLKYLLISLLEFWVSICFLY